MQSKPKRSTSREDAARIPHVHLCHRGFFAGGICGVTALAAALASKTEFTPDEFKAFNVTGLRHTHYVQSTGGGKFSPAAGAETTVRLVGSSCQKVAQRVRRSSKDLWDDDNKAGVNDKMTGGVGMEELF